MRATKSTAAVFYPDTLAAQFDGRAVPLEAYDVADYAVLYVAADQRNLTPAPLAAHLEGRTPLLDVELNGIRYARVYPLPAPEFAGRLHLEDIRLDGPNVLERGGAARLVLRRSAPRRTRARRWRSGCGFGPPTASAATPSPSRSCPSRAASRCR